MGLVAAAGGDVNMGGAAGVGVGLDGMAGETAPLPNGSEPPPPPAVQRRRRVVKTEDENEDGGGNCPLAVDDRYLNACAVLGLQSKPVVLKALRTVEQGAQSLPVTVTHGSYLGNRGGQALFLALAADSEDIGVDMGELRELRNLDLQGQGLGNEAAIALASLLARCPRLRSVNLARNHISETGAMKLMYEIQTHPSLDMLNLDQNPVPSWIRVRLKEMLATRK